MISRASAGLNPSHRDYLPAFYWTATTAPATAPTISIHSGTPVAIARFRVALLVPELVVLSFASLLTLVPIDALDPVVTAGALTPEVVVPESATAITAVKISADTVAVPAAYVAVKLFGTLYLVLPV